MFNKGDKVIIEGGFNDGYKGEIVNGSQHMTFLGVYYEVKVGDDIFMHSGDKLKLA